MTNEIKHLPGGFFLWTVIFHIPFQSSQIAIREVDVGFIAARTVLSGSKIAILFFFWPVIFLIPYQRPQSAIREDVVGFGATRIELSRTKFLPQKFTDGAASSERWQSVTIRLDVNFSV